MNVIQKHGSVLFRASLYFTIAAMAPVIEKIVPVMLGDKWPSKPVWVGVCILAVAAGLIALRAFYDGSAERRGQELKAANGGGNGNNTGNGKRKLNPDEELTPVVAETTVVKESKTIQPTEKTP